MKNFTKTLITIAIIISLQVTLPVTGLISNILEANTTVTIPVGNNVFTNTSVQNTHSRRFLAIGNFYDTTDTVYYPNSEAYLNFNLSTIPAGAVIENATVTVYKYANGGAGFTAELKPLTQGFATNTGQGTNDYRSKGDVYSVAYIDNQDLDFDPINFNAKKLVQNVVDGQPNYGFVIDTNAPAYQSGAAVCSTRNADGLCNNNQLPKLTVEYTVNQAPYTPNPVAPVNLKETTGGCDESVTPSTGNCRTTTTETITINGVGDGDPAPGDYKSTSINFVRTTTTGVQNYNSTAINTAGTINYTTDFTDGEYTWKARSIDKLNLYGNYSAPWKFTTDTTPPSVPNIINLPEYSSAVQGNTQVEVNVSEAIDNVQSGTNVNYILEYSTDPDFSTTYSKAWQEAKNFEIGPFGIDQLEGTADDIVDGATYYFRTKSRDKVINDEWNTSAWSDAASTIIDSTKPVINNFTYSVETENEYGRFSPSNITSVGQYDTANFEFDFTEANPLEARIEIYKDTTLIKTIATNTFGGTINLSWDGTNNAGQQLLDGPYTARAAVEDLAGNLNEISEEFIIILDNSDANIAISNPIPNFWTNKDTVDLSGQILNPNVPGEEDQDLSTAEYNLNGNGWNLINYDGNYIFEIQNIGLPNTVNTIVFRTEDTVGNVENQFYSDSTNEYLGTLTIKKDQTAPEVEIGLTDNKILTDENSITFTINDVDSGINFANPKLDVSLEMEILLTPGTNNYVFAENELYANGTNLDDAFINDIVCTPTDTFTSNNLSATHSANCTITFVNGLPLDTQYRLNVSAQDIATNSAETTKEFSKDSTVYLEIVNPDSGISTPNNYLDIELVASENSELTITNPEVGNTTILVGEAIIGYSDTLITVNSVECGQSVDADLDSQNAEEAVCTLKIRINQKASETGLISNVNTFGITDEVGNTDSKVINANVDITNFTATISSDLQYFSPNGDGNQDFVVLSHRIDTDSDLPVDLDAYTIFIEDSVGNIVQQFSGDTLGGENIWTAQNGEEYVADGLYKYYMQVVTNSGVATTTSEKELFIFTDLQDEIYITSPVNGGVSSDGVIEIQGQSPINTPTFGYEAYLRGLVQIQICIDNISTPGDCDDLITTDVDTNGFFSAVSVLPINPDEAQTHFKISAIATDAFGNETSPSNVVNITYDVLDPFNFISITPTLVGTNTDEDYQRFLDGEITIDELKSVRLEAGVSENTSKVEFNFVDSANVAEHHIGTAEGPCNEVAGCVWSTNYPISYGMGGVYEVEFTGYKDAIVQTATTGFRVDGTIPSEAAIIAIEKQVNGNWYTLSRESDTQYYSNSGIIKIKGVADPSTQVNLMNANTQIGSVVSQANGLWVIEIDMADITAATEFILNLSVNTQDGVNTTEGSLITVINYDQKTPEITMVERIVPQDNRTGWVQTGHSAQYRIETSEKLKFGDLIKEDGYIAQFNQESTNTYIVTINVDRNLEGYYNPSIRLIDLAGNINQYDAANYEGYGLGDFRLYIDNTKPIETDFDRTGWSTTREEGGINADGLNPEIGRTSPGYVYRNNSIIMYGYAEKGQRVEILVNSERVELVPVYDYTCLDTDEVDQLAPDGLVIKHAEQCKWNYTLKFTGAGLNNEFGVPNEFYTIQTRVYDNAANKSKISDPILIYYDTQAPKQVRVVGVN